MKTNQLTAALKDLGMSENEAKVYFASLSLGPATILKIAQAAELKRTTAYSVIESLKQMGLMNIQVAGFKRKFVAEDPNKLEAILEARKQRLKDVLPEFSALYNLQGGESFIKYYEGLESVKGVYEDLIREIKPHEDYLVIGNVDHWIKLDREFFTDFSYRRAKMPIKIRLLVQDTETGREWLRLEKNFNSNMRLLPAETNLTTNLVITPQKVLIHQLTPPVLGIVIGNRDVIRMHTELFEVIWKGARGELSH